MSCYVPEYSTDCEVICTLGDGVTIDRQCLENCYAFAGCPWPPGSALSSSSVSASGFDWEKAAQGFSDSQGIFFTVFACFLVVKILNMARH